MTVNVTYYPGGSDSSKPASNKKEQWDSTTGLYTAWDEAGQQREQRPLNAAEASGLAAQEARYAQDMNAADLDAKFDNAIGGLRTYIGLSSPTAAQTTAAVKLLCRVALGTVLRLRNRLDDVSGT